MSNSSPEVQEPSSSSHRRTLVGGGAILIAGFGLDQSIRFISNVILARLLDPISFGLMALCITFMVGITLFSDLGIRTATIQSKRGHEEIFLNTAWTVQALRGLVLWIVACALAYPAAYWRPEPEPRLLWILPTVGLTAVFDGFVSMKIITLHRQLKQATVVKFDLACQIFAVSVQLIWASVDQTVNALVAGILTGSVCKCLGSHLVLSGPRSRIGWDWSVLKELAHVAGWVYVSTIFWFLASQTDKLVVGLKSLATLGVYNFAVQLIQMPIALCGALANRLLFPYYSQLKNNGSELRNHYRNTHKMAGFLAGFFVTGAATVGPALVSVIYDSRYQDAVSFIPLLAAGALFQILDANGSAILTTTGRIKAQAFCHLMKVIVLSVGIPYGYQWGGMSGFIFALILGDMVRYFVTTIMLDIDGFHIFHLDIWWIFFAACVYVFAGSCSLEAITFVNPDRPRLIAIVTMLTSTFCVVLSWVVIYIVSYRIGWLPNFRKRH